MASMRALWQGHRISKMQACQHVREHLSKMMVLEKSYTVLVSSIPGLPASAPATPVHKHTLEDQRAY